MARWTYWRRAVRWVRISSTFVNLQLVGHGLLECIALDECRNRRYLRSLFATLGLWLWLHVRCNVAQMACPHYGGRNGARVGAPC